MIGLSKPAKWKKFRYFLNTLRIDAKTNFLCRRQKQLSRYSTLYTLYSDFTSILICALYTVRYTAQCNVYIREVHFQLLFFLFFWHLKIVCEIKKKSSKNLHDVKKTFKGRYRRLRWFYFNFDYFVIMILRYFYWAPQISVRN